MGSIMFIAGVVVGGILVAAALKPGLVKGIALRIKALLARRNGTGESGE